MLFLLLQLGRERYALEAATVVEVLPMVEIKKIPHAPVGVAGVCNRHGGPVPVLDFSELILGRPAPLRLSTRIILVQLATQAGKPQILGLIAEKATETMEAAPQDFVPAGVDGKQTPYLGPVIDRAGKLVQWVRVQELLPASVLAVLFSEEGGVDVPH